MLQTRTVEPGTLELLKQLMLLPVLEPFVKSLTYFEDAEQSANPVIFDELVTWKKVKTSIKKAVKNMG